MTVAEFSPEIVALRTQTYARIRELLSRPSYGGLKEAIKLHNDWLARFPNDFVALDAGEVLAMTASAYQLVHTEG